MSSIALIDLDGVVADNSTRAAVAQGTRSRVRRAEAERVFYETLFNPDLVELDQLLPGAGEQLARLRAEGFLPVYLSSRSQSMHEATVAWLARYDIDAEVILRPQYEQTVAWKTAQVQRLVEARVGHGDCALVIDDREDVRHAVLRLDDPRILVKCSLEDALATDRARYPFLTGGSELLRCVQELANAACYRHRFETDDRFELRVEHRDRGSLALLVQAAYSRLLDVSLVYGLPLTRAVSRRVISVVEVWPAHDGHPEIECFRIDMDEQGTVLSMRMANLEQLGNDWDEQDITYSHPFSGTPEDDLPRLMEGFANWKAKSLRDQLYLAAARYQRDRILCATCAEYEYQLALDRGRGGIRWAFSGRGEPANG